MLHRSNKLLKKILFEFDKHEVKHAIAKHARASIRMDFHLAIGGEKKKKNERRSDSIFIVPLLWKRFHKSGTLTLSVSLHSDREWMEFKGVCCPVSATCTNDSDPNRYSPIRIEGRQCRQVMTAIPLPRKQRIIRDSSSSSVRFSAKWRVSRCWISNTFESTFQWVYIDIKSAQLVFKSCVEPDVESRGNQRCNRFVDRW